MSHQVKQPVVPAFSYVVVKPGENTPTGYGMPGGIVIVHDYHSVPADLIRFGEELRESEYSWANHGMVLVEDRNVVQETAKGAVVTPLLDFKQKLYVVVQPHLPIEDPRRQAAVDFAMWTVGEGYGWASIAGDAIDDATGLHLELGTYGRMVCSAAASRAAERWGLIPDKEPAAVQPDDLARYFWLTKAKVGL